MAEGGGESVRNFEAPPARRKMPCRLGITRTEQPLRSSKSSPPFTVKIWLFGTPLSLAKLAVLSVPITSAPVLLAT